ncbi:MAG: T9SS type A sorting domain-containing protein [Ferruginibacter sp.]
MKSIILYILSTLLILSAHSQIVNIPDANFKNALLNHVPVINTNGDGEIQVSEAVAFVGTMNVSLKSITNMTGVEAFVNMTKLYCEHNQITTLPVSGLTGLQELQCSFNSMITLNLANMPSLLVFNCQYTPMTSLTISNLPLLYELICHDDSLITLSISNAPNISNIVCYRNQLTSFTLTPLTSLVSIDCAVNKLTSLPLTSTPKLYSLNCSNNLLSSLPLNNLNFLISLDCSSNQLSALSIPNPAILWSLWCYNNQLTSLPTGMTSLLHLICNNNQIASLPTGMNNLTHLICSHNLITSLTVDNYNSLQFLKFNNNLLTGFSLTNKPSLEEITCDSNLLSVFSISNMPALTTIECPANQISSISLNNFPALRYLYCNNNLLSSLQLTNLPALFEIRANNNNLTSFSLSGLAVLGWVQISYNQLSSLSLNNLPSLAAIYCSYNLLTQLDLSNVPVRGFSCNNNPGLLYINIKNNAITANPPFYPDLTNLNLLQAICVDDPESVYINKLVTTQLPGQNISVSSFCGFTPTGNYNTIVGTTRFDQNTNGCNNLDSAIQYMRIDITDGVQSGSTFTNTVGNYKFFTQLNPNTLTTSLPNNWFTITPPSHVLSFTGYGNMAVADFCVTANGVHHDLDIVLLPISGAVPGFDATYRIIYSNKGNQSESGTITLNFNNIKLNFLSATPVPSSQSPGNLTWTYTNLSPFQSGVIDLKFHVYPPPVNNVGDILSFISTINPVAGDETPADNIFSLNETVINSIDPNDKTVTEGTKITIDKARDYLHYLVRFQNIGTANAVTVIIKDSLPDNLDWNSFLPVSASHSFRTVITKGNKVEFIFANINLPGKNMNEPASHGFVAFKIKPKPGIAVGETIYNKAEIYFDFNLPIITNTVSTTITDPVKTTDPIELRINPNPVKDHLFFTVKNGVPIMAVNIYTSAGVKLYSEIIQNSVTSKKIDVSNLPDGMLFLEVISSQGRSVQKVIKLN